MTEKFWLDRRTDVILLTGAKVAFTPRHIIAIVTDRVTLVWNICGIVLVALVAPYAPFHGADPLTVFLSTALTVLSGIAAYDIISFFLLAIFPRLGIGKAYPFVVALPSAGIMLLVKKVLSHNVTHVTASPSYDFMYLLFMAFFLEAVISVYCQFHIEAVARRHGIDQSAADSGNLVAGVDTPSQPVIPDGVGADGSLAAGNTIVLQGKVLSPEKIIALSARGKFVCVHTPSEKILLRMAFSDALELVSGLDGLLIHRSHWVQRQHVVILHRDQKRNLYVEISGGAILPASRTKASVLKTLFASAS